MQTIRSYSSLFQAQTAKAILESEGIAVYLKNEHLSAMHPFYGWLTGGIDLQVAEEDAAAASELLGYDPLSKDAVTQISRHFRSIFWPSLGVGLVFGLAYIMIYGTDDDSLMNVGLVFPFVVVAAIIVFSLLFPRTGSSSKDDASAP